MKQFFSIICYLLLAQHMYSQTQKGHWLVGANVGSGGWGKNESKNKMAAAIIPSMKRKSYPLKRVLLHFILSTTILL